MNYCKIIIGGRLTRDPETKQAGDTPVVKFGLAYDAGWGDKKRPVFVDVVFFGKRGEALAKFHQKGDPILIDGELRLDQWEDKKSGEKRSKLYVVGNEWSFVGSRKDREASAPAATQDEYAGMVGDDDEIPF